MSPKAKPQTPPQSAIKAHVITSQTDIHVVDHRVPLGKDSKQLSSEASKITGQVVSHPLDQTALKAIGNSYHMKALSFKTTASVGLGFDIYDKKGELINEEAWPDFLHQANPMETFDEVIQAMSLDLDEVGQGHFEVVPSVGGKVAELYWVPSENLWLTRKKNMFHQVIQGQTRSFVPFGINPGSGALTSIVRVKTPSNRSQFYGVPDWVGAIGALTLDSYAVEWNYRFFLNNAIPAYAVIVEGGEFDEAVELAVQNFFTQTLKGVGNSHKTLYLPIDDPNIKVRFEELMKKPAEGDFQKLRQSLRDEVLSAHGVPPRIMGVVSSGSLGGGGEAEQQLKIFKEVGLSPRQRLIEGTLDRTILKADELHIKFRSIDLSSDESDVKKIIDLVQGGLMEVDEGREALGSVSELLKADQDKRAGQIIKNVINLRAMMAQWSSIHGTL